MRLGTVHDDKQSVGELAIVRWSDILRSIAWNTDRQLHGNFGACLRERDDYSSAVTVCPHHGGYGAAGR